MSNFKVPWNMQKLENDNTLGQPISMEHKKFCEMCIPSPDSDLLHGTVHPPTKFPAHRWSP